MYTDPYKECPVLASDHFTLRLVKEEDVKDLLECYSDKSAVKLFNNDNCPMDFYFDSEANLLELIQFWLYEYGYGGYVRFAILDKEKQKAIGTIEIFAKKEIFDHYGTIGTLRLDLQSAYETEPVVKELFVLIRTHFKHYFKIDHVITKAKDIAVVRQKVLTDLNFIKLNDDNITAYPDYFIGKV